MRDKILSQVLGVVLSNLLIVPIISAPRSQTQTPQQRKQKTPTQPTPPTGEEIDPDDVIRINTTLVTSPVLVIGREGKFIPNLNRDDFEIYEDGVKQQIASFSSVSKPFTVALLLDTSRSTGFDLEDIKDAAISFVDKMRPDDRALVVSASSKIKVLAEATSDHEKLKSAIQRLRPEGNSRIYDAISLVITELLGQVRGRTALILFSDGVDNSSHRATFETTLADIDQSSALIYPVQFSTYDKVNGKQPLQKTRIAPEGSGFSWQDYIRADDYLHQAAALSGTAVYPALNISDLDNAIADITDELHNEYALGYYPATPLQPHEKRSVEVRTKMAQLVIKARTSYSRDPSGTVNRMKRKTNPASFTSNAIGVIPSTRLPLESNSRVDERWICKSIDAPTDFAVIKEGFVSHCPKSLRPNDNTNAWLIVRPPETLTMCKGFLLWQGAETAAAPVPTGYVVTAEVKSPVCAGSNDPNDSANAWMIHRPIGRVSVCKGFQIPRGFVMVSEVNVPGCPSKPGRKNGWIIRPK